MTVRQQFSSMFDGIREIANNFKNGSEFKFSSEDFMSNLDFDVAALERYRTSVLNAEDPTIALQELLRSASAATYDYASSIDDVSAISLENFRTSQIQAEVAKQAANKKLAAARPLISEYATRLHQCELTTEQFTDAEKESLKLAKQAAGDSYKSFMSTLKNGERRLVGIVTIGYGASKKTVLSLIGRGSASEADIVEDDVDVPVEEESESI